MNPFEIVVANQTILVHPRLDNAFDIFVGLKKVGSVLPIIIGEKTKWTSKEFTAEYAIRIGKQIEKCKF